MTAKELVPELRLFPPIDRHLPVHVLRSGLLLMTELRLKDVSISSFCLAIENSMSIAAHSVEALVASRDAS